MIATLQHFFFMGGYGFYIWSSYGCVLAFLIVQWWLSIRRSRFIYQLDASLNSDDTQIRNSDE